MSTDILWTGPAEASVTLLLAHGAGAPMDSGWMNDFSALVADRGIRTARFEFGYMAARRQGTRRSPPRADSLLQEYRDAVTQVGSTRTFIGGKSMGGRVASMVADELYDAHSIEGLVCLGYPFHPPGRPEQTRTAHLVGLRTPTLVCQGTRDPFGTREDVGGYTLAPSITIEWLEDGDHEFRPRKASGLTFKEQLATAADAVAGFTQGP